MQNNKLTDFIQTYYTAPFYEFKDYISILYTSTIAFSFSYEVPSTSEIPLLSIACNIAAVYKKESIKTSCESLQTRWNKTKIPSIKVRKSTSDSIAIIIASVIDAN